MPSEKPKILFVANDDLIRRIDDYRFENRIKSQSEAIRRLLEAGLAAASKAPRKKPHKKE